MWFVVGFNQRLFGMMSDAILLRVKKSRSSKVPKAVMRCDLLRSTMNPGKAGIVHAIIDRHRRAAPLIAREQWRQLFETGAFDDRADSKIAKLPAGSERDRRDAEAAAVKAVVGSAARTQMLRRQVVGQLRSWMSNRANDFRDMVEASGLDDRTRHMLHAINVRQAWHSPDVVTFGAAKEAVPNDVLRLARRILRAVTARHRRPSWAGLPVQLDQREVTLLSARRAVQDGRVTHWLRIVAAGIGKACVPLVGTPPFLARRGPRANTVRISRDRDGVIAFGVITDITESCAASRQAYVARTETIALDFGLTRLFATDRGDLIGRSFMAKLISLDATITGIVRHAQRAGTKPRDSVRYRRHVARLRGFVTTEINRVLNHLVEKHAPGEMLLERLSFSHPALSRRMNRLVSNCGRSVVKAKLADLADRFGIALEEVDPAYTSQTCSSCGHVHRSNRSGDIFRCRRCGLNSQADVNAARNIRRRRSLAAPDEAMLRPGSTLRSLRGRRRTLEALRQDFERRHPEEHRRRRWPGCRSRGSGPAADSHVEPVRFAWDEVRRTA